MITQEKLKENFVYDSESGIFSRKDNGKECLGLNIRGYVEFKCYGVNRLAHRLAWLYVCGEWPKQIDHINGNRKDNRIVNLRNVGYRENTKNQRMAINNKSGVVGVYWSADRNKWRAVITADKKVYNLGCFEDLEVAKECRKFAEKMCGFHENHGNKLTL